MKQLILTAVFVMATTSACEQKPKSDPAPTPTIQPAQPAVPANTAPQAAALEPVPVSEDFEEQASVQITADNLDSELEKLEREITE